MRRRLCILVCSLLCSILADGNVTAGSPSPGPDLIPAPRSWQSATGTLDPGRIGTIDAEGDDLQAIARQLADILPPKAAGLARASLQRRDDLLPAAYRLTITPEGLTLAAADDDGFFHGLQTVRQLILPGDADGRPARLPCGVIDDAPAYRWRGLLLDCGRHFMPVELIKDVLDWLALHKFNVLHWHLTEDQGWRLEIPAYPRLTEIGAWRTEPDGSRYGGYYTAEQVSEIVAYAAARHITVVPEIEMPGHSVAALAAYPQLSCTGGPFAVETRWGIFEDVYCAGNDETFVFLEAVLLRVMELFPGRYIHIGGDEVPKTRWRSCPRCRQRIADEGLANEHELQSWFIRRMAEFLAKHNRQLIGWDEIIEGGLAPGAVVQAWRGTHGAIVAAQAGHDAIVSPTSHAYFDYDVGNLDLQQVYTFDPVPAELDDAAREHILGGAMNLWTEYIPPEKVWTMLLPRAAAMAECLWTAPQERDFGEFLERWRTHERRLARLGFDSGPAARPVLIEDAFDAEMKQQHLTVKVDRKLDEALDDAELAVRWTTVEPADIPDFDPKLKPEQLQLPPVAPGDPVAAKPLIVSTAPGERRLIVAQLFVDGERYGTPALTEISGHAAVGRPVTFTSPPSRRYPTAQTADAGGGLTDGLHGSWSFRDGRWAGFEGADLIARVDLGEPVSLQEISLRFVQDANAWIFFPVEVDFEVSPDGDTWLSVGRMTTEIPDRTQDKLVRCYRAGTGTPAVRFVRVTATSPLTCPDWHPGRGQPCWLFADELVCRPRGTQH